LARQYEYSDVSANRLHDSDMTTTLRAGAIGAAVVTGAVFLAIVPSHVDPSPDTAPASWLRVLNALPHHAITSASSKIAAFPIPSPLRTHVFSLYSPSASEASLPLRQYSSLASFFARELKDGLRPVDRECSIVAPADATVVAAARLGPGGAIPALVKGASFTLRELISAGDRDPIVRDGSTDLYAVVLRISPRDCHQFFSPTEWTIEDRRDIAGRLSWLNSPSDGSGYSQNERIALVGSWEHGFFSLTAIGACGVGSIALRDEICVSQVSVDRGHSLGGFRMGSAMVVVFEAPSSFDLSVQKGHILRAGQPLGRCKTPVTNDRSGHDRLPKVVEQTAEASAANRSRIRVRRSW
jgi:phosphatidylserine decarboxylase